MLAPASVPAAAAAPNSCAASRGWPVTAAWQPIASIRQNWATRSSSSRAILSALASSGPAPPRPPARARHGQVEQHDALAVTVADLLGPPERLGGGPDRAEVGLGEAAERPGLQHCDRAGRVVQAVAAAARPRRAGAALRRAGRPCSPRPRPWPALRPGVRLARWPATATAACSSGPAAAGSAFSTARNPRRKCPQAADPRVTVRRRDERLQPAHAFGGRAGDPVPAQPDRQLEPAATSPRPGSAA